jgi:hypothetical protein
MMLCLCGPVKPRRTAVVAWITLVAGVAGGGLCGCVESQGGSAPQDAGSDLGAAPDAGAVGDLGRLACDPPLSLAAPRSSVLPLGLLTFAATGGTGRYRYALAAGPSGAILNELTGAYLAGQTTGVEDVVEVTDLGCLGSARASVTVVVPMVVAPLWAELLPGTSFTYEISGGSGTFFCALEVDGSGATLDGDTCAYTAGAATGVDVVEVEDAQTGETRDSTITVTATATLRPDPARIFVPLQSDYRVSILGGSGTFDAVVTGTAVTYADGVASAVAVGSATLDLSDRFTGLTTSVVATVVEHVVADLLRSGDQLVAGFAHAPGDLDGDGYSDALLGWPEADVLAFNGGAVFVYRGGAGGLAAAPARALAGTTWGEEAGRAVGSSDFDGDGRIDVVVGAPLADVGLTDNGEVRLHYGAADGLPALEPATTLDGAFAGDSFGSAVTTCDFNDDERMDLAVGARFAEDRDALMPATDQGAAFVFFGGEDGFASAPQVSIWGSVPDGLGGWVAASAMRLGTAMASGDVDGDGICDLVVGAYEYTTAMGRGQDGAVFVHHGVAAGPGGSGGPATIPSLAWASSGAGQETTFFGRHLAVGDLDGDGLDDVAAGQYRNNAVAGVNERQGAVRVFAGRALGADATAFDVPESADWTYVADNPLDAAGYWVEIADADGDGRPDLLTGAPGDESPAGTVNAGAVLMFRGQDGVWPAAAPAAVLGGLVGADNFGQTFATLDDADGDGLPDLFVMAALDDTLGMNVGRPSFVSSAAPATYVPLDLPGSSSGQQVGRSVAITGDLDGDGFADLAVGAPDAETAPDRVNQGVVHLYLGGASGFATAPALTFANHAGHGAFEQFGWDVADAGDFDGDGRPDLAVLARFDDRPNTFGPEYANPADCPGTANDPAAVFVFRGGASGLPSTQPAFVYYGPQAGQIAEQIAGGFDANGDGYSDLLLGGPLWDRPGRANVGGFAIISGRPAAPAGITVICAADYVWLGLAANDQAGLGLAGLGDLDADGCDEFAVGTWSEDLGVVNQGTVRAFRGWGGGGCPGAPEATTLGSFDPGGGAGFALGSGADLDGDGRWDLAVGAPLVLVDGNVVGAAWLLRAADLLALPTEAVVDDVAPGMLWPLATGTDVLRVDGAVQQEGFGVAVALVPGYEPDGRGAMAVGGPLGAVNGFARTGGVRVFRYNDDMAMGPIGLEPTAVAAVGGESDPVDGRIGEALSAGILGGAPVLVTGGTRADANSLDRGAAYVVGF